MKLKHALSLSTRMFKTRPMRTFLTILGVGVGIGAVLFLVSLGYGLQNMVLNRITTADSLLSLDVSPGTSDLLALTPESVEKIYSIPNVAEVSPAAIFSGQISLGELTGDGTIYAVKSSFFRLNGLMPDEGMPFIEDNKMEAVISSAGARLFNFDPESAIGEQIMLTVFVSNPNEDGSEEVEPKKQERPYLIRGVINDENTNYLYIPIDTLEGVRIEKYDQLKVKASDEESINEVREQVMEMGFSVSSLSDTIEQAKKIFRIIQIILALFGFIALIVSAIGMFNTMTIALLERINEIGIMRAIGVRRKDIIKLFLLESVTMGFLGGVGGVVIGFLSGELANLGLNILAKSFGGQAIDVFYCPPWFIAVIIASSTVIGLLTGIYPSRRAAKLNPLEALRYK